MFSHNDYLKLTKDYLREYETYKAAVKAITQAVCDLRRGLAGQTIKTVRYDDVPGGGGAGLNSVEQAAENRIHDEDRLTALEQELGRLKTQVQRIGFALAALGGEEMTIVEMFYFQRLGYAVMATRIHASERTCRRRVHDVTQKIALLIFGIRTKEKVMFLK